MIIRHLRQRGCQEVRTKHNTDWNTRLEIDSLILYSFATKRSYEKNKRSVQLQQLPTLLDISQS